MPPSLSTREVASLDAIEEVSPDALHEQEEEEYEQRKDQKEMAPRLPISRAVTEPSSPGFGLERLSLAPTRKRPTSPYSRHIRSRSGHTSAPIMTRAHSSPVLDTCGPSSPYIRPASPHYSSVRRASPLRHSLEESTFSAIDIDETISEHDEFQPKPRPSTSFDFDPISPINTTFSRPRRAPPSPLQHLNPALGGHLNLKSSLRSHASSPTLRSFQPSPTLSPRFQESFPGTGISTGLGTGLSSNTSSIASTPTSFRSRSPSISSLETIPDSPDAEQEAIAELERDKDAIARLKAAIEREGSRRGSFEGARGRGIFKDSSSSLNSDKRKRWSVCGAERRSDLDLETIWED